VKADWRAGILAAIFIVMEGCWLYVFMSLLNSRVAEGRLSVWGLLLVLPLAFAINSLLFRLRWPALARHAVSWLSWAAAVPVLVKIQLFNSLDWLDVAWLLALPEALGQILYTFRPELLILIGSAIIWWLGRRLAIHQIDFAASVGELQFGLAILALTFLLRSWLDVDLAHQVPVSVTFFLFALLGVSVAHTYEGAGWLSGTDRGQWSGLLIVSIGLVVLLGALLVVAVSPEMIAAVLSVIKRIWEFILKVIMFLVSLIPEPEPAELPPGLQMPEMGAPEDSGWLVMPESLRNILRLGWNILVLGSILFALGRLLTQMFDWLRRRLASTAGAEVEPLRGAFRFDLLRLLRGILSKLFGFRLSLRPRQRSGSIVPEVASVRQIYRQLLEWGAAGGHPRQVSQTPDEYSSVLSRLLPEAGLALDSITRHYVSSRYGLLAPAGAELEQLRQRWCELKQNRIKEQARVHCKQEV